MSNTICPKCSGKMVGPTLTCVECGHRIVDEPILKWARRRMRRPGSWVDDNIFVPMPWHIQGPSSGTYCGVNVLRYAGDRHESPLSSVPDGELCGKCLRQYRRGRVLPQGGGSSWRKG